MLISGQPTGESIRERLSLLGEIKYDSKNNSAIILMVVKDRYLISALVEPYAHGAHLIAKIGPIQKDFHRVHIPNSALMQYGNTYMLTKQTKRQFPHS